MSNNSIFRRSTTLMGLLLVVVIIGGFFIRSLISDDPDDAPVVESKNNGTDATQEASQEQGDVYNEYQIKLDQALALKNSLSASEDEKINWKVYKSEKYGFQFQYPEGYIVANEAELVPSENAGAIFGYSLVEDSSRNRSYLAQKAPDAEPPASISVIVYQKDHTKVNLSDWVPSIVTADEKEIPGIYEETRVSAQKALLYTASTMYEYDFVIVENNNYIYNFNVGFTGPEDQIRKDFYRALFTVIFR